MLFKEYFHKDLEEVIDLLLELEDMIESSDEISSLITATEAGPDSLAKELLQFRKSVRSYTQRSLSAARRLERGHNEEEYQGYVMFLVLSIQSVHAEVDELENTLEKADLRHDSGQGSRIDKLNRISALSNWIRSKLRPVLKKVANGVWKIISNMMTPKGWSISGELGTGILGLAKVQLEITFGS